MCIKKILILKVPDISQVNTLPKRSVCSYPNYSRLLYQHTGTLNYIRWETIDIDTNSYLSSPLHIVTFTFDGHKIPERLRRSLSRNHVGLCVFHGLIPVSKKGGGSRQYRTTG